MTDNQLKMLMATILLSSGRLTKEQAEEAARELFTCWYRSL